MKPILTLTFILLYIITPSCKKNPPACYSEAVYQKHKNDVCPFACTNITGCDERQYCNECEANKVGIRKK